MFCLSSLYIYEARIDLGRSVHSQASRAILALADEPVNARRFWEAGRLALRPFS